MKKNIDKALRLFTKDDEFRRISSVPFKVDDVVVATNYMSLMAVNGLPTNKYIDNDNSEYGKRFDIGAILTDVEANKYVVVEELETSINGQTIVKIDNFHFRAELLKTVIKASKLLGISQLGIAENKYKLFLQTDKKDIRFLVAGTETYGEDFTVIPTHDKGESSINKKAAKSYLEVFDKEEQREKEEAERKRQEYLKNHHTIWRIPIKRTEVGYLLVDAPDEETALAIAKMERPNATFDEDFDYEIEEYDIEEDVDHEEIQEEYERERIFINSKNKWGYNFVRVDEYEYFDKK